MHEYCERTEAPMPIADNLPRTPLFLLAQSIRKGELSATTLVEQCLRQIRETDSKYRAFIEVYETEALQAAASADALRRSNYPLPPLHGLPIALKDLIEIEGRVTTAGSMLWRERKSAATATIVMKLLAAGMIILGKTHLVEFAFGSWGTNERMGTPWNPWDTSRHRAPGGSSSGSAVAVAAGLVPAAIGSDTGGSIRIPASQCGLVGLKTTVGRISNQGVVMLSETLDTLGPITQRVEDAALLFAAMHGPDPADARTLTVPPTDVLATLNQGIRGIRLAVLPDEALEAVDPDMQAAFVQALTTLEKLGATITTTDLPRSWTEFSALTGEIIAIEGYTRHRAYIERSDLPFDPHVQSRFCGSNKNAADYIAIMSERQSLIRETDRRLASFDALLLPSAPFGARELSSIDPKTSHLSQLTRPVNFLDLCALSIPCGFDRAAMPLSLQIIGRGYCEGEILRIGRAYEAATEWHRRLPPAFA
jgi:aspartyl-tRNA(Asn)/glutamyl-tRNA(Gln) amidotransferase subunit A